MFAQRNPWIVRKFVRCAQNTHIHGLRTKSMDFRASGKYGFTVCAAQSVDCANPFFVPNIIYTEYVKKNATNVPQRHLKMRCHVRCFLSPCVSHFDGHAAVRHLVKRSNPWIAARLLKCGTLRKKCRNSTTSGASSTYPEANHKSAAHCLIKLRSPNFTNCILFYIYHIRIYI